MILNTSNLSFGPMLKQLRKHAGLTQRDLAAALNYSDSFICSLEKEQRQPDLEAVIQYFIPALSLQDDPQNAATLVEQAALACGQRPPAVVTFQRTTQLSVQEERVANETQLPALPTELIGRSAEIEQLCNRLLGHSGRLLTLQGPPGIGKTTLALAVATRLHFHYRDGVIFVPLAAISDPTLLADVLIAKLGLKDGSKQPAAVKLIEFLRRKELLLLLDNFEQIVAAAPLIAELLTECPALSVLVTSRERLHLRMEQRYKVAPLTLAAAVELFTQRARATDGDFACTIDNQPTLAAICQRLDCLPLAIELCAAQIDLLAPTQLLAQLQTHRLDLLVDGASDLPLRQRTLRNAIDYSYTLLAEEERQLFRSLGVFAGEFDLEAVAAVSGWLPETNDQLLYSTLHALISKSLVRVTTAALGTTPTDKQGFVLLETIREFAAEQLTASAETQTVRQRHACYFRERVAQSQQDPLRQKANQPLDQLERDHDNLRAALQWLIEHDGQAAQHMVGALCDFWYTRSYFGEGRHWAKLALAANTTASSGRAAALYTGARLAFTVDDHAEAFALSQESLAIYRQLGDQAGIATVSHDAGWIAYQLGRFADAHQIFDENVTTCRSLSDKQKLARALNSAAMTYVLDGVTEKFGLARSYFAENLQLAQAVDWQEGVAYAWQGLAMLEQKLGNYSQTITHLQQALIIFRQLGFQRNEALTLRCIGEAARLDKQWHLAQEQAQAALDLYQQLQVPWGIMASSLELGMIACALGHLAEAEKRHCQSLLIAQEISDQKTLAVNLASLSEVRLRQHQPQQAAHLLAAAQSIFDRLPPFLPPGDVATFARLHQAVQASLGEQQFTSAWQQGQQTEVDAMIRSLLDG